jgi:hypothetical protein
MSAVTDNLVSRAVSPRHLGLTPGEFQESREASEGVAKVDFGRVKVE